LAFARRYLRWLRTWIDAAGLGWTGPPSFHLLCTIAPCFSRVQVKFGLNAMGYPHSHPNRPKEAFLPNPKLKLLDQCREVMRFKHLSRRTEETYLQWIRRFIWFHRKSAVVIGRPGAHSASGAEKANGAQGVRRPVNGWIWRHPKEMGEPEVRAFLTDLAVKRGVVAATQNQALNALLFLYREVVGGEMASVDGFERARRSDRVPMVEVSVASQLGNWGTRGVCPSENSIGVNS